MNKCVKLAAFGDTKDSERGKLPQKGFYWSIGKLSSAPALRAGLFLHLWTAFKAVALEGF